MIMQESDVLIYPDRMHVMSRLNDAKESRIHVFRNMEMRDWLKLLQVIVSGTVFGILSLFVIF